MPGTTYLANKILDGVLRGSANWVRTSNLHFALFTERPTAAGGGTEVSGGSYARVLVTATAAAGNFEMTLGANNSATAGNHLFNAKVISWPRPTLAWGEIVSYGIYDASSGGNLLWYDDLPSSMVLGPYQQPTFPVRSLEYGLGGAGGAGFEQRVLNYLFRGIALGIGTMRMTLMTAGASTAINISSEITPAHLTGGVRPLYPVTTNPASGAAITNSTSFNFSFLAGSSGYTVSHFAIVTTAGGAAANASTADEILFFGELGFPTVIPAGANTFTMPVSGMTIQLAV